MELYTIDFETYYSKGFSLSKMRTDAYVKDPQFKVHSVQIKHGDRPATYHEHDIKEVLESLNLERNVAIGHNMYFDGLILSAHYGIYPSFLVDTMSISRQVNNHLPSHSLASLCKYYGIADKDVGALTNLMGVRDLKDLSPQDYVRFVSYATGDVDKTWEVYKLMRPYVSSIDMRAMDYTLKMFTAPKFQLDTELLREYMDDIVHKLDNLVESTGFSKEDFSSTNKFAAILKSFGIDVPMKTTEKGNVVPALSKTDEAFKELQESDDEFVQVLCAARLGVKSTQARTRAESMIDLQEINGKAPILLNWAGASATTRTSGGNKMNFQNMKRGSVLRKAVVAPPGYMCVVVDSSNIESRVLDYLAGEEHMIQAYKDADSGLGPDIYCILAARIYNRLVNKSHKMERQLGKMAKLGLGFGMGGDKFYGQIKTWDPVEVDGVKVHAKDTITPEEAARVVHIYRESHPMVKKMWRDLDTAFKRICHQHTNIHIPIGRHGITVSNAGGVATIHLFDKLALKYEGLSMDENGSMSYTKGKERSYLYGGKLTENVVQAVARQIVSTQMVNASMRLGCRPSLFVHDEVVWVVPEHKAEGALEIAIQEFKTAPKWIEGIPLNGEGSVSSRYGDAK